MLSLEFNKSIKDRFQVLCLGAHSDDIEIGCGGTILRLGQEVPDLELIWIVFGAGGVREQEARKSASKFLSNTSHQEVRIQGFRDGFFPYIGGQIKDYFEQLKSEFSPDVIFTHYRNDLHQDHRLICELTWNTYRDHFILEYEIPKFDGDLGNPNFFVHLEKAICHKKVQILLETFDSQRSRSWFTEDTFFSLMRLRGVESNALSHYAEGFFARKIIV